MGRPCDWVEVEEQVHPNLLPLCWRHHEDVTGDVGGYRAGIRYEPESGCIYWCDDNGEQELVWGDARQVERAADQPDFCKECGRRKPRRPVADGVIREARPKTRLVLTVPQDERENGEAIVRDLLSQACELLGRSDQESYYALVESLYWFVAHYVPEAEEYTGEGPCPTCGRTS